LAIFRLSEQTELPPEEASNVVTAEKMRGTISRWVRNTVSHHTMRLGEGILPPMFPFLLTFDPRKRTERKKIELILRYIVIFLTSSVTTLATLNRYECNVESGAGC